MPSEITRTIDDAMKQLPQELRRAITLRETEGLSYEAVAEVMDCPIDMARSRIVQARDTIAQKLRPVLRAREHALTA